MVDDGLSSSRIRTIYQDRNGFIWVTGENGLDKITGDHIQRFLHKRNDLASISNNNVSDIYMTPDRQSWIGTGKGLNRYSGNINQFEQVLLSNVERPDKGFSISRIIASPMPGKLLVSTGGHGLYVIASNNGRIDRPLSERLTSLIGDYFIGDLIIDAHGWLWATTSDKGFRVIDLKSFKRIGIRIDPAVQEDVSRLLISCFKLDNKTGNLLIGSASNGLYLYDNQRHVLRKPVDPALRQLNIQSMLVKRDGTILLGTENNGIRTFDRQTETIRPFTVVNNNLVDLEHSKVHALLEDNAGNLWAGLYQKGLFVVPKSISGFDCFTVSDDNSGKNRACVSAFAEDHHGNTWIATDGGGLFEANGTDLTKLRARNNGLTSHSMVSLMVDKTGTIWAGSYGQGLFSSKGRAVFTKPELAKKMANDKVMCLEYDRVRNYLYAGTNGEKVDILDLNANRVRHVNVPINKWVRALHLDHTGRLWIGTSEGVFYYDVDRDQLLNADIGTAGYYSINCFEETGNTLFIGTIAGLVAYDMKQNKHTLLTKNKSSELNCINTIVMGDDQSLWFTTPKSLSRLNLKTGYIRNYYSFEGFHIGEFRYGAVFKGKSGALLFGGDNGIVRINPLQFNRQQSQMRPIYLTALIVNNNPVDYDSRLKSNNVLDAALSEAKTIKLSYKDNSFTLCFSAQEYAYPQKVNYSYCLIGYDHSWHHTDASNAKVTYVSLPPGRYTFLVKGYIDEAGKNVTSRSIKIYVKNPWYGSPLAKCVYLLLILLALYVCYLFYKNKQEQRRKLQLAQYNEQVKEDKLRLFTSIANEIKTPLNLIISPLKKLMSTNTDTETQELHNLIYRNSMRILQTINQLLDIRKLDDGQLKLHFNEQDLITLIKHSMLSFKNMATVKHISFSMETSDSVPLAVWIDNAYFDKIIYNILSNAFKFTPASGKILIRIDCKNNQSVMPNLLISDYVEIRIFNTGTPIEEADLNHIFERFYQGNRISDTSGPGIGLHLAYELVLLHHGQIEVHNINNEGIEFVIRMPLGNAHLSDEEQSPVKTTTGVKPQPDQSLENTAGKECVDSMSVSQGQEEETADGKHKYTILVVDDDEDFCLYLKKELSEFTIHICTSGNKAWKQLLSLYPDVVVTDYLMPDGNGLELCQRIKSNPETDSIPVILLTSEDSEFIQMQSVSMHADRYLTKPLNMLLLKGAIGQALRVREKIRNKIHRTEMGYNYEEMVINSADDKLVKKVIEYIKANLEDSEMSVETLSKEVGLSRVHLNRKLKEILGISPSILIKSIRLKQAAYLLVNNKVNISEVAYKVGFSSHSYFSYNFHEFFGMSPKEFIIYYAENQDEESIRKLLE
ncbi:MAG: two-component regulator propeller domain-containing protein [Bacteroidota bacterium]|nr:two-component regulator propeller domain-containing protein [Bacteroidota bacterium]